MDDCARKLSNVKASLWPRVPFLLFPLPSMAKECSEHTENSAKRSQMLVFLADTTLNYFLTTWSAAPFQNCLFGGM